MCLSPDWTLLRKELRKYKDLKTALGMQLGRLRNGEYERKDMQDRVKKKKEQRQDLDIYKGLSKLKKIKA